MSGPDQSTPLAYAAWAYEIGLGLAGLWILWSRVLRGRGAPERRPRLEAWNLAPVDFACYLCLPFLGATLLSWAGALLLRGSHLSEEASMAAGAAALHLGVLAGVIGFAQLYRRRLRPPAAAEVLAALRSGIATFMVAIPVLFVVSNAWEYLLDRAGIPADRQTLVDIVENTRSTGLRTTLILEATLLVPFSEELLFRGGLFRYARTRMNRWAAVVLTSLIFGALHVGWGHPVTGLASLMPLSALAVLFCLAYERTGTLGTVVVAHALFNLNTFVLIFAGIGS